MRSTSATSRTPLRGRRARRAPRRPPVVVRQSDEGRARGLDAVAERLAAQEPDLVAALHHRADELEEREDEAVLAGAREQDPGHGTTLHPSGIRTREPTGPQSGVPRCAGPPSIGCPTVSMDFEIGRAKRARRVYAFDDVAVVPSRRTRDPEDVSTTWSIDAFQFAGAVPVRADGLGHLAGDRDRVRAPRRPRRARARGPLDALRGPGAAARGDPRAAGGARHRSACRRSTGRRSAPT